MANVNEVRLIGRLTRDPELREAAGKTLAQFGLAIGNKYKAPDSTWKEETTFVDVSCWGKLAESVSKYMKKGRQIYVAGRLKFDSWDDKQTGQKRSKLSVVAEEVQFLDRREDGEAEESPGNFATANRNNSTKSAWEPAHDFGEPPF